jgi:soluble lytic murein transglycosylase
MIVFASLVLGLGGATAALHAQQASTDVATPSDAPPVYMMAPIRSAGDPPAANAAPEPMAPIGEPVLSPADRAIFIDASNAADRNDWVRARQLAAQGSDPIAKRIIQWRYVLDETSGASFQEIGDFLYQNPNWPRRDTLLARAEKAMPPELAPAQVIAWFGTRMPVTSQGRMRLGQAMMLAGRTQEGSDLIRKAWIENNFTPAEETQILFTYGSALTEVDQRARLDRILATEGIADAQRQMARVDAGSQALADARLRLKLNPTLASTLMATLAPSVANDARFQFDYARALRRFDRDEEAWTAMLRASAIKGAMDPNLMWSERHIMARDALKARRYDIAYALVADHGVPSGAGFADGEFLAGWIALRWLDKPEVALTHFQRLAGGVTLPISRARAWYWSGRALEALGRMPEAETSYRKAANDSSTFYGQLALTHMSTEPVLQLTAALPDLAAVQPAFQLDDRVRAMRVLADLGQRTLLRVFAFSIANETENGGYFSLLADLMSRYGDRTAALRIAKLASYKDVVLLPYLDPLVELPAAPSGANVEPALILGLTRQESEFDAGAVSTAGARGLMQLMPATARRTANQYGIGYRQASLNDPSYNMQLGMAHLNDLLRQWNGSYILTIASYNAGAGNVENWIETYGDPRGSEIDPLDWLELIPFGETRNYVQRVLENTQVYRNRLAGSDQRLALRTDLHRPNASPPVALVTNLGDATQGGPQLTPQ